MSGEKLKRSISLPLITFYGLGTILGAGVYVLIGKVAGMAGYFAPIAFIVAALVAGFTAFAYCELSSRYPKSSGETIYLQEAFNQKWLSTIVGCLVILTGVVSAATISNGFVGYLNLFMEANADFTIIILVLALTLLAIWGITESVSFATIVTLIELGGLLFVITLSGDHLLTIPDNLPTLTPEWSPDVWLGICLGGFLAFYAFIGFEDMVNIAEEVKNPERNMPLSILLSFSIATVLYVIIALIAVLAMPLETLSASDAPLATLLSEHSDNASKIISLISLIAVVNGALVQIIMASRVFYGMSCQGLMLAIFSRINEKTNTPILATLVTGSIVLMLALWFPLVVLAKATSFIVLTVFLLVNIALIVIKQRTPVVEGCACYPMFLPIIGALLCIGLLGLQLYSMFFGIPVAGH